MNIPIKCDFCGTHFGHVAKDGIVVYQSYGSDSNLCTLCATWSSREQSRRYDYEQTRATKEGRRSGGNQG
jgi:peptide methionine sulfoxide reductase MsrB